MTGRGSQCEGTEEKSTTSVRKMLYSSSSTKRRFVCTMRKAKFAEAVSIPQIAQSL